MIRLLLICICVLTLHKDEVTISWSASYKLAWRDFQGPPKHNSEAVATTASGITFSYSIKKTSTRIVSFQTQISAHFYPEKSWYKAHLADQHILSHEQYHFNVTELYARKFRQRVDQVKISESLTNDLDKIHQDINTELSDFQERYDAETDYSRNFQQQAIWQKHIDEALEELSKYKLEN